MLEFDPDPSVLEVLASLPVLTLVLTLLPAARRWATDRTGAEAFSARTTTGV